MSGKVGSSDFIIPDGGLLYRIVLLQDLGQNMAKPGPGASIDERLRAAYVEFSNLCKQHKIRTWV